MWHKNLESILAASGSLTLLTFLDCENVLQIKTVWRKHPWSKRPRAGHLQDKASPGPSSQSRGQESHRFCPCFWGRSHQYHWRLLPQKPPCKEPPKVEPQNHPANDFNDWRDIFAVGRWPAILLGS